MRTGEPRFGIVGAGAAGIAAADALRRLGYSQITILEKDPGRVGGKCRTQPFDGVPADRGAIYVLPNYPVVEAIARDAGVSTRPALPFVHLGVDGRTRPFGTPPRPISLLAKAAEYARLGVQLVEHRRLLGRPLGRQCPTHVRGLALPLASWMKEHRLDYFQEVAYPLLRSFGFGFEEQQIPAAYVFNALPLLAPGGNLLALWDPGSVKLRHLREGYGEMWRRAAAGLDVRLGAVVKSIDRSGRTTFVHTASGDIELDRLILACPLDEALAFLDASPEETRLFGKVRWLYVWQATARVDGLGDAVILDENQVFSRLGHTMIFTRYEASSNVYYLFGYATESMTDAAIQAKIAGDVASLGGTLTGPPALVRWKYFPHYSSNDVFAGCLSDLERLQGRRRTWYVGELLSNIGVEPVARYAARLVERAFAR